MRKLLSRLGQTIEKRSENLPRDRAEQAFAAEFVRLLDLARAYARRRLRSLYVEDVVMEAFEGMWTACYARGELPRESPETLLLHILRRRIYDQRLREEKQDELEDDAVDLDDLLEPRLTATRVADSNLLQHRIDYLLEAMPELTREVFRSAQRNDWDLHVTAEQLRMPYETARGHFKRAKQRLAHVLRSDGYDVPPTIPRGRGGRRKE